MARSMNLVSSITPHINASINVLINVTINVTIYVTIKRRKQLCSIEKTKNWNSKRPPLN